MKKHVIILLSILMSSNINASILDNNNYTTIDGLDWLDLSATGGLTLEKSLDENLGWRIATKNEFDSMFSYFFSAPDSFLLGSTVTDWEDAYNDETSYVNYQLNSDFYENTFTQLFGMSYDGLTEREGYKNAFSYGYFMDNDSVMLGGLVLSSYEYRGWNDAAQTILGWNADSHSVNGHIHMGTYLVREVQKPSSIPEPSSLALLILGLLGIFACNFPLSKA